MDIASEYDSWYTSEDGPHNHDLYDSDVERAFSAGFEAARNQLTKHEWEIVSMLIGTGENECPWAWEPGWPKDFEREDAQRIIEKFREFVDGT